MSHSPSPRSAVRRLPIVGALLAVGVLVVGALGVPAAEAGGRVLDGRQAPDIVSTQGINGLERGVRLSALKGKPVFLLFWLRDCPHCAKELPRIQALYERFKAQGLQMVTVVHKYRPAEVLPRMQRDGYTFPVVSDLDGSQARAFGVGRRPATYLIGIDGRVRTSNRASDRDIGRELGRYRLAQAGSIPAALADTRDMIWQHRLGDALRKTEPATKAAGADPSLAAFRERVKRLAQAKIQSAQDYAAYLRRGRRDAEADRLLRTIQQEFAGTSLAPAPAR